MNISFAGTRACARWLLFTMLGLQLLACGAVSEARDQGIPSAQVQVNLPNSSPLSSHIEKVWMGGDQELAKNLRKKIISQLSEKPTRSEFEGLGFICAPIPQRQCEHKTTIVRHWAGVKPVGPHGDEIKLIFIRLPDYERLDSLMIEVSRIPIAERKDG